MFSQNLVNLFPHEGNNINTLSDLLMDEKLTEKEREEKFYEIASKDKNNILKSSEPIKKNANDNIIQNNNTNSNNENKKYINSEKDQKHANDENINENIKEVINENNERNNNSNENYAVENNEFKDNEGNKVEIIQKTSKIIYLYICKNF